MEPFIAQICLFGFNWAPQGWAYCDGSLIAVQQNTALYSLLGTNFGGDGRNNFGLPDLRGRVAVGQGTGTGLTPRSFSEKSGFESVVLTENQMPIHSHAAAFTGTSVTIKASAAAGAYAAPSGRSNTLAASSNGMIYNNTTPDVALNTAGSSEGTVAVGNAGAGQGHMNMQPYLVLNYCIATQGYYPSRP
ncbi:MAG: phage tail protein [Bacteroidales bacterium]|nr:phage tail protein [Bacteroidales bacterium]MBN2750554.1 phage tail protein [Bacteroidales bacterium]